MTSLLVELKCTVHGLERFKIKVIKKYNVNPETIMPKFRTRPKYELSSIVIGRNVGQEEVTDYLIHYFREAGIMDKILSMRLNV